MIGHWGAERTKKSVHPEPAWSDHLPYCLGLSTFLFSGLKFTKPRSFKLRLRVFERLFHIDLVRLVAMTVTRTVLSTTKRSWVELQLLHTTFYWVSGLSQCVRPINHIYLPLCISRWLLHRTWAAEYVVECWLSIVADSGRWSVSEDTWIHLNWAIYLLNCYATHEKPSNPRAILMYCSIHPILLWKKKRSLLTNWNISQLCSHMVCMCSLMGDIVLQVVWVESWVEPSLNVVWLISSII